MKVLILCLAAAGGAGNPEESRRVQPLPLEDAIRMSLESNLDVEIARVQPWIEDQNITAAEGPWDHTAYASGSRGDSVAPGFSFLSGGQKVDSNSTQFAVGVRKAFSFGPSYDLRLASQRDSTNNTFIFIDPRWTESAGMAVTVPLLKGGSPEANEAPLIVARRTKDISVDQFERTLTDSVFQVIQAYGDLVFAVEHKKVKDQSLEVARKLLEDNRRKFDRGVVARIDVTEAEAGLALQQEGILTAEAEVLNATDRLKRLVDPALLNDDMLLSPTDLPEPPAEELDEKAAVEETLQAALERRPEIGRLQKEIANQGTLLAKAGNDRLPRLDLTGRATVTGTEGSFSEADEETRSTDFRELAVELALEWPLEGSSAKGAYRRAELEERRLRLQELNLENQVRVEVREAVRSVKTNEKRIEATRRARILAEQQLDGEMTRREQGLSTTFRVLDVEEDVAAARTRELKALIDHDLSRHRLLLVKGALLEENGIVVQENLAPRMAAEGR